VNLVYAIYFGQVAFFSILALLLHVFQVGLCKFLKFNKLFFVDYLDHQGLVVGFGKTRVALASRAIPALAAI